LTLARLLNFTWRHTPPLILQTEAGECGLACLAMVAAYHGHDIDLATLRRTHSISAKGATMAHLVHLAGKLGLSSRPVKAELEDLWRLATPAVLHWNFNHFVVLVRARGDKVVIHDPARGACTLSRAEVSRHFTGICLELAPNQSFERKRERLSVPISQLLGGLRGARGAIAQVLAMAAALEVFAVLSPFFIQLVVDQAVVSADRSLVAVLAIGFLLVALTQVGITAARAWLLTVLGTSFNLQLVTSLFSHLLRLPMSYFEKRHLGDIASRFESLGVIQRTLTTSFSEAVVDGVMALVTLAVMLAYSPRLTLIVCAAAALYAALRVALYNPMRQAQNEQIAHAARQQSFFLETVRGIQSVKLFDRQTYRNTIHRNHLVDSFNAGIRVQRLSIVYQTCNGTLFGVESIAVVWLGALAILDGSFTVGMLFAFVAFRQQFVTRLAAFVDKAVEFHMLGLHAERVGDVALSTPETQASTSDAAALPRCDIELRDVTFRYSEHEPAVLRNVSLRIEEGESVAIVGPSGCGKTTLLKVILGLLTPTEGEVLIGGVRLAQLGTSHRQLIGTVMQEDELFAGSLAENISFFDPQPERERIEACAKLAAIHADILRMPMGYESLVGDMGSALSGGQQQRILLARALYKQPRILALDEATSHLDVACERAVNEAVRALKLTRVIIAHRPETIHMAGRIITLHNHGAESQLRQSVSAA
jgi:ATP-binding cassette, subfamily B, bacterial CvaB/MchF/RaxB